MIDPRIEMVDLEPDGFAIVNSLVSEHLMPARPELHVLSYRGRIVRAVHTREGVVKPLRGRPIDASPPAAEALRAEAGVARVILVDEERLAERAEPLTAAAEAATQDEMIVRSRLAFFGPGVIAVPPITLGAWKGWATHLRVLGPDYVALLAGYDGAVCVFTLVATVHDGLVCRVTSMDAVLGTLRPPLTSASDLVTAAGTYGPVRIAVIADLEVFAQALSERSIEPLRARAVVCVGLPAVDPGGAGD